MRFERANCARAEGNCVQRLLVVEDSPTMRDWIATVLEELEPMVKIDQAASGFEALRLLPRQRYDLIVTDINMPDINGLELISFVRRTRATRRRRS